jgi:hypothetical protein
MEQKGNTPTAQGIEIVGNLPVHSIEKVAVDIENDPTRGMSETLGYQLRMRSLLDQHGDMGVSKIVEPESSTHRGGHSRIPDPLAEVPAP